MARMIVDEDSDGAAVAVRPTRVRTAHPVSSVIAFAILAAFALTCVVVFAGSKLGLRDAYPVEQALESVPSQPTPAAP